MNQRVNGLAAPAFQQSLNRSARDTHSIRGFFLLSSFTVAKPHGLQLIQPEFADLDLRERNPGRLIEVVAFNSPAVSYLLLARHVEWSIGGSAVENNEPRPCTFMCI